MIDASPAMLVPTSENTMEVPSILNVKVIFNCIGVRTPSLERQLKLIRS